MGTPEHELESLETLAKATGKALSNMIITNTYTGRFLRKLHNRASGNDPLQEGYQTRLDADILEELEALLQIQPDDSEETRPD